MLNSAQLHYLLEHYKLTVSHPDHWTPSDSDEEEAYNLGTRISVYCVVVQLNMYYSSLSLFIFKVAMYY